MEEILGLLAAVRTGWRASGPPGAPLRRSACVRAGEGSRGAKWCRFVRIASGAVAATAAPDVRESVQRVAQESHGGRLGIVAVSHRDLADLQPEAPCQEEHDDGEGEGFERLASKDRPRCAALESLESGLRVLRAQAEDEVEDAIEESAPEMTRIERVKEPRAHHEARIKVDARRDREVRFDSLPDHVRGVGWDHERERQGLLPSCIEAIVVVIPLHVTGRAEDRLARDRNRFFREPLKFESGCPGTWTGPRS